MENQRWQPQFIIFQEQLTIPHTATGDKNRKLPNQIHGLTATNPTSGRIRGKLGFRLPRLLPGITKNSQAIR